MGRGRAEMEKALLLVLFSLSYGIVSGQFCQDLPQQSEIIADFRAALGGSDQSSNREFYYNCIAYDGASQNHRQTTITVRYITGSSVFSARGTYVCGGDATNSSSYAWKFQDASVVANAGTTKSEVGCSNCMASTDTTCTRKSLYVYVHVTCVYITRGHQSGASRAFKNNLRGAQC